MKILSTKKITKNETLGDRIALIRKKLGLDQSEFALKLGITSPVSISRYENNRVKPEISLLVKIAELGNTTLDWLLTGDELKEKIRGVMEKLIVMHINQGNTEAVISRLKEQNLWERYSHVVEKALESESNKKIKEKPVAVPEQRNGDPELAEIMELLSEEDPGTKKALLKMLRGKKEMEAGLEIFKNQLDLKNC